MQVIYLIGFFAPFLIGISGFIAVKTCDYMQILERTVLLLEDLFYKDCYSSDELSGRKLMRFTQVPEQACILTLLETKIYVFDVDLNIKTFQIMKKFGA